MELLNFINKSRYKDYLNLLETIYVHSLSYSIEARTNNVYDFNFNCTFNYATRTTYTGTITTSPFDNTIMKMLNMSRPIKRLKIIANNHIFIMDNFAIIDQEYCDYPSEISLSFVSTNIYQEFM